MNPTQEFVPPPASWLALTELPRALTELAILPLSAPLLVAAPQGDGHPVLVIPGFGTSDSSTTVLRRFLALKGYEPYAWELGRNLGDKSEELMTLIEEIHAKTGRRVSLVGQSLGGILARQMATQAPHLIRQVITLGSPFNGDPRSTNAWPVFKLVTGQNEESPHIRLLGDQSREPIPTPSTAIYSRADGIAAWQVCCDTPGAQAENVEIPGSHCGMSANAAAFLVIADRLAQADGEWAPFERAGMPFWLFPQPLQ